MAKKSKKKLRKELENMHAVQEVMLNTMRSFGTILRQIDDRTEALALKYVPDTSVGDIKVTLHTGPPTADNEVGSAYPRKDGLTFPDMQPVPFAEPPGYETAPTPPDAGVIGWDAEQERPVKVGTVTPNRDPEASEYTFWFTEEMCMRLGIPNIQRHLVEKKGGALEMVDGPPTKLLPEHREIVDSVMSEEQ